MSQPLKRGREQWLGFFLRIGQYFQSSPTLRRILKDLNLDHHLRRLYGQIGNAIDPNGSRVVIEPAEAVYPDLSLHHITNERPIIADLLGNLRRDDIVYDIGAAVGLYSCLCAKVIPPDQVFAFEPAPNTVKILERNIRINDVTGIQIIEYALSDDGGTVPFSTTTHQIQTRSRNQFIDVPVYKGDVMREQEQLPFPTVMKIDVEGAEVQVLRGFRKTLSRSSCRLVYCEVHPEDLKKFNTEEGEVRQELERTGFDLERLKTSGDGRYTIRAAK